MGQTLSVKTALRIVEVPYYYVYGLVFGQSDPEKLAPAAVTEDFSLRLPPKFDIQQLPNELLLHIFSYLELKPYIISRGVCTKWKKLLPLANIHPIRRRLFDLFHRMLNTPCFPETRPWTVQNLQYFDRKAYIDALLSQYPAIPEEFRLWILEWPARMAIACSWPGLPHVEIISLGRSYDKTFGANWLGWRKDSPTLLAAIYRSRTPTVKFIPALLAWKNHFSTTWLIFEKDEPNIFGRVYLSDYEEFSYSVGVIPTYDDGDDPTTRPALYADWITYQEDLWHTSIMHRVNDPDFDDPDELIISPVSYEFESRMLSQLPLPPLSARHEPLFRACLEND